MTEQRYKAVLAVIGDGRTVDEVARDWGISRRTMHRWLARCEGDGLEGLNSFEWTTFRAVSESRRQQQPHTLCGDT